MLKKIIIIVLFMFPCLSLAKPNAAVVIQYCHDSPVIYYHYNGIERVVSRHTATKLDIKIIKKIAKKHYPLKESGKFALPRVVMPCRCSETQI